MSSKRFGDLIGSIDEGTSSARFLLFKAGTAEIVCYHQLELAHSTPHEGWVEQDPMKILRLVNECIEKTVEKLIALGGNPNVGINVNFLFALIRRLLHIVCDSFRILLRSVSQIKEKQQLFGINIQANRCTMQSFGLMHARPAQWMFWSKSCQIKIRIITRVVVVYHCPHTFRAWNCAGWRTMWKKWRRQWKMVHAYLVRLIRGYCIIWLVEHRAVLT